MISTCPWQPSHAPLMVARARGLRMSGCTKGFLFFGFLFGNDLSKCSVEALLHAHVSPATCPPKPQSSCSEKSFSVVSDEEFLLETVLPC